MKVQHIANAFQNSDCAMTAETAAFSDEEIAAHVRGIVSGPRHAKQAFVLAGYTYEDVYEMASGLLSALSSVASDSCPVCLCAENKAVIASAFLARLAGGPPLVLPYAHSPQVLEEMCASTGFRIAVTDGQREFPAGVRTIFPEHVRGSASGLTQERPLDPNAEVLRLYTGGSTGKPRTWSKTVKNLLAEAIYLSRRFEISHRDRFLATVSPSHIYGLLFSVLVPFVASAVVLGERYSFPSEILSGITGRAPTVLVSVPVHYRVLRGQTISGSNLRIAFSSAGVLDKGDGEAFHKRTGIRIVEIYGSTETGGIASRCRADGEKAFTPFEGIDWMIADERLHVRSDFVSGEIERAPDGFVVTPDRATLYDDNSFLLQGRSDSVVKVGGKRVDLEEVRSKVNQLPGVRDCIVISVPFNGGRENAIAALIEGDLEKAGLRRALADVLEPYALPRIIKIVASLPYTAAGKYDRKAIEEMFQKGPGHARRRAQP